MDILPQIKSNLFNPIFSGQYKIPLFFCNSLTSTKPICAPGLAVFIGYLVASGKYLSDIKSNSKAIPALPIAVFRGKAIIPDIHGVFSFVVGLGFIVLPSNKSIHRSLRPGHLGVSQNAQAQGGTIVEMIPVSSECIRSVGYLTAKQAPRVEFTTRKLFEYARVPADVYDELMSAKSHGTYFNANIRNAGYPCREIPVDLPRWPPR